MQPDFLSAEFNFDDPELVSYLDELPFWSAPFGIALLEKVRYKKNITALDIGCGTGFPLTEIAMRLGSTSKVYGLDPWTAALDHLTSKLKVYNISNVELINGYAEEINLPDNSIDLIVSNNGLNNVQDLRRSLSECRRIAKNGCQFVATMNLDKTMIEFYNVFKDALVESGLRELTADVDKHIYEKRKPVDEMIALFEENNFRVNKSLSSFSYKFADGTSMLNYFLIRIAFIKSWKKIIPSERAQEIFLLIESKLNAKAHTDNGISLSVPYLVIDAELIE
ncbi:MAG: class I SAM-dependent methyltransferase [Ignavibacteriales bacterium]|nr:MAG: class I SAM-dependent methyltransferase [Ignavibacteriales bacterium]